MVGRELPAVPSNMGLVDVAAVFSRYWPGGKPSREALALVLGKSALETFRWKKMIDWNFGGIKSPKTDRDHTYFWTAECVSADNAQAMIATSTAAAPVKMAKDQAGCDAGKVRIMVGPKHPWARFRAFESAEAGARDYLGFLSRNEEAWKVLTTTAEPRAFVHALKAKGYFTASEKAYADDVVSLQKEFLRTLPATIPEVESIAPERLALPGIPPNPASAAVLPGPSIGPAPSVPAAPRGSQRGASDLVVLALLVGAAYVAVVQTTGGFRAPTVARAR